MMEQLNERSDIVLLNAHVFPPADAGEISSAEDAIGHSLDDDIRLFYKETDGLQIRWIFKNNKRYNPHEHTKSDESFSHLEPLTEEFFFDGCINILPLRQTFTDIDWRDRIWFDNDEGKQIGFIDSDYDQLFIKQHLRPFDLYGTTSCMAFFTGSSRKELPVILLQDYYLDFTTSRVTNFTSYLEFLLANWGSTKQRYKTYSEINGHQKLILNTPAEYWNETNRFIL